ncbi:hypothetical protein [Ktedonobacter sp. SOSP1-85]|uniref:hypothetical protein n=1 Tax=Ktedonobacter sp. SOSP1-85 TaxID=2778367 RepID=UPI0019163A06|nr:hypothetical protein [Ktedonobacter sp. SOSP1-85]
MRRSLSLTMLILAVGLVLLLAACSPKSGSVPSGIPDTGNGTPAVLVSPTPTLQAASAGSKVGFYTFVRQNQLWMALNSENATQVTHFDFSQAPEVFWQSPAWSPDHKHLSYLFNALPAGVGGGGCPEPDYTATSSLYVLDTSTQQLTSITLPQVATDARAEGKPRSDSWQYAFWEDAQHLLAWYNGVTGKTSNDAGLYRYDLQTHSLIKVASSEQLGATSPINAQQGQSMLLSLRYRQGQLYYETVEQPGQQDSRLAIYRLSVNDPGAPRQQVVELGKETWCAGGQSSALTQPGWDISPDGTKLVVQKIENGTPGQEASSLDIVPVDGSATQKVFLQAPATFLAQNALLRWSPQGNAVVASERHHITGQGPYLVSLDHPQDTQAYAPFVSGAVSWRSDGQAFALQSSEAVEGMAPSDVYLFAPGEKNARLLEKDARVFSWG